MSGENVEIVRQLLGQFWTGQFRSGASEQADATRLEVYAAEQALPVAPDVEWDISGYPTVDLPTRGSGRDNLGELFQEYISGWTSYQAEATEFIDAGKNVVGVLHERVGIGDSGDILERDLFGVWTLRDGLIVKWRAFETREQALEAAGLRE